MESNVDTFACPCMFDCPARMNTFSGLAPLSLEGRNEFSDSDDWLGRPSQIRLSRAARAATEPAAPAFKNPRR